MSSEDASADEVRSVLDQYFYGIDAGRADLVIGCFADFAEYSFAVEGVQLQGRQELTDFFAGERSRRPLASCHSVASQRIDMMDDKAEADTFAIAHLVLGDMDRGEVLVRGLRYRDSLADIDGSWRIMRRRHHSLWQYCAPAMPAALQTLLTPIRRTESR